MTIVEQGRRSDRTDTGGTETAWDWARVTGDVLVAAHGDFDVDWERAALHDAARQDRPLLSVRVSATEILIGPLWIPDGDTACAGCAHAADTYRTWAGEDRFERDRAHREWWESTVPRPPSEIERRSTSAAFPPWLHEIVAAIVGGHPEDRPRPGELVAVARTGTVTRHQVRRTLRCRVCAPTAPALRLPADPPSPPRMRWQPRPTVAAMPTRAGAPYHLDPDEMRAALADPRFGPITRMTRHSTGAFPISEVELLVGTPAGMGRADTYAESEAIGVLEAFERMAGYPHAEPILVDATFRDLGERALDPATLGWHTPVQLAAGNSRLRACTPDTPLDWVWAHPLRGGEPTLVPAEIGFFRYRYGFRAGSPPQRNCFLESSSGSALGSSREEATLHSLLELAERDAFLLAWHRKRPLPRIDPATVTDPRSRMLLRMADDRGYDIHLLVATADIAVPVIWALAINRERTLPASFSTAGCHPDPAQAIRAALWELSQMVVGGVTWDPDEIAPLVDDPWLIETIAQHWRRYTVPELLPRVETVLGGDTVAIADAFPGWPAGFVSAAGGDITRALGHVHDLFGAAGLDRILVVDQTTADLGRAGMSVVKCIVPGIVPMCFGHAHQRLAGLPRLLDGLGASIEDIPFDPHPFP